MKTVFAINFSNAHNPQCAAMCLQIVRRQFRCSCENLAKLNPGHQLYIKMPPREEETGGKKEAGGKEETGGQAKGENEGISDGYGCRSSAFI